MTLTQSSFLAREENPCPMNNKLRLKLLRSLATKKESEGLTLIELLVVVIIIGVLAAIAIPNLLGQVGKARETEAINLLSNINRSQQSYFAEKSTFATSLDDLQVTVLPTLKSFFIPVVGTTSENAGASLVNGINNASNGTRDYIGAIAFNTTTQSFSAIIGRANAAQKSSNYDLLLIDATGVGAGTGKIADVDPDKVDKVK